MARRPARKRRKPGLFMQKLHDLTVMVLCGFVVYAVYGKLLNPVFWVLLGLGVSGAWWLFLMPTRCDLVLHSDNTRLCSQRVRGKLVGCIPNNHERDKRDAVWALLNLRNPGMIFRVGWRAPSAVMSRTPAEEKVSLNAARDTWMLFLTALSTVAGVAGAVFAALSLR